MILDIIKEKLGSISVSAGDKNYSLDMLKLRRVRLDMREKTCLFNFAFPILPDEDLKEKILTVVREACPPYFKIRLKIDRDYFDLRGVQDLFGEFLSGFQALSAAVSSDDISFGASDDGFCVEMRLSEETERLVVSSGFAEKFADFVSGYTNYKILLKRNVKPSKVDFDERIKELDEKRDLNISAQLSLPSRKIKLESVKELIGRAIDTPPKYILDVRAGEEVTIVCGKVHNPTTYRPREKDFVLCKFDLQDFSGEISCVYFAKDENNLKKFLTVYDGDEIVVRGKTTISSFTKCEQVTVYQLSRCKIADEDASSFVSKPPCAKYMVVEPQPYIEPNQMDLLGTAQRPPQFFLDNTVVVFDFETTGLKVLEDKIIEIGAVKMINGEIKESFNTLVNPQKSIDARITELTGISDEMVENAPTIQQVIGDFYKFCFGSVMVAHNLEFDYGFLRYFAKPSGYLFDNKKLDTLELSRQLFSKERFRGEEPGKFTLDVLTKHFEIPLNNAHRSLCDAAATAHLLKKLLEKDPNLI